MSESQSSYRQVVKATSIFGGVQVFNILISLLRSKAIALFLGPAGMGIAGLFNAATGLMSVVTNFGLDTSAVKSLSVANAENDSSKVVKVIAVLKRLVWITGILGALLTIVFSPLLSRLTFGNSNYTVAFIWISVTLLFRQLSTGQIAVLQGMRRLQYLAKANLLGSFAGLVVTVPLYYYYGIDAIVPAIVLTSAMGLLFSWIYSAKVKIETVRVSNAAAFRDGKAMLQLGFSLSFIGLLTTFSAYLLQVYIGNSGGLDQVGLFNAGFALINSYVGLIFTAMGTDYFPRLASIASDKEKVRASVLQQALIAVLVITPIIIVFLALAPFIIHVLFSKQFLPVVEMACWGILGMLFKAVSWSMGYILIARGDSKMFIRTSLGFNSVFLIINILGYHYYGLEGLGISFLLNYIIHFFGLKIITRNRYDFYFGAEFYKIFILCLLLCGMAFLFSYIPLTILKYGLMAVMAILSIGFSLYELNKKTDLKSIIKSKMKRP